MAVNTMSKKKASDIDWQLNKTALQCNEYMFHHQIACDVHFHIRNTDSTMVEVGAHMYVLISRSPVFYAMFCGEMASDVIDIEDCDPEAFDTMLRYLYTDYVQLNANTVMSVMYISKKYMLLPLLAECKKYLETSISAENVSVIYQQSVLFGEDDLSKSSLDFIRENTDDVIKTEGFRKLSHDSLKEIVKSDTLEVSELSLFNACLIWAANECERQGNSPTPEHKRAALGDVLYMLRFPLLSSEELADFVFETGILSKNEIADLFLYQYSTKKPEIPFPLEERQTWKPICYQLCDGSPSEANCTTSQHYKVAVTSNRDIDMIGLQLFNGLNLDAIKQVSIGISQSGAQLYNSDVSGTDKEWCLCEDNVIDVTLSVPVRVSRGRFTVSVGYKSYTFYGQGIVIRSLSTLKKSETIFGVTLSEITGSRVIKALVFRRS